MERVGTTVDVVDNRGQANRTRSEENQLITSGTDPGGTLRSNQSEPRSRDNSVERVKEYYKKNPKCHRTASMDNPRVIRFGLTKRPLLHENQDEHATDRIAHPTDELWRINSNTATPKRARVGIVTEYSHDMDFAEDVSASPNPDLEQQIEREDLYRHENPLANIEASVINPGEPIVPGEARVNRDTIVNSSTETNITDDIQINLPAASKSTSAEVADDATNAGPSTDDVHHDTVPPNGSIPKPSPAIDNDQNKLIKN